ncbi:MAG: nucleotidyltransferase family protein [Motiliproteus sp.]
MSRLAVMIMAAGQSARFGGCKQLADVAGKPMLQRSIYTANQLCPGNVFVVSGGWHQALTEAFEKGDLADAQLLYSDDWQHGLGNSIARGVAALAADYEGILIMLADQVAVSASELQPFVFAYDPNHIICSLYQGRRGVPALFPRQCFTQLQQLSGDSGAKKLLYSGAFDIVEVPLPSAAIDIDQPEELRQFTATAVGV